MITHFAFCVFASLATRAQEHPTYAERGYPLFGSIVAAAGDVNGDGVPDLVLGDPGWAQENIPPAFWIVSGKDDGVLRRITLTQEKNSLFLVDGGVDLDGDGVPDLMIATHPMNNAGKDRGGLYLISGKSGATLHRTAITGSWGRGDWAHFVTDVDHDGVSDVGVLHLDSSTKGALFSIYSGRSGKSRTWLREV